MLHCLSLAAIISFTFFPVHFLSLFLLFLSLELKTYIELGCNAYIIFFVCMRTNLFIEYAYNLSGERKDSPIQNPVLWSVCYSLLVSASHRYLSAVIPGRLASHHWLTASPTGAPQSTSTIMSRLRIVSYWEKSDLEPTQRVYYLRMFFGHNLRKGVSFRLSDQ